MSICSKIFALRHGKFIAIEQSTVDLIMSFPDLLVSQSYAILPRLVLVGIVTMTQSSPLCIKPQRSFSRSPGLILQIYGMLGSW